MKVILITCQFIAAQYNGCPAVEYWCKDGSCLISEMKCDISKTGHIWLPQRCFKEIK